MKPRSFRIPIGVSMQHGFACQHCGPRRPLFRRPATAGRHVQHCIRNPQVRACATCEHDFNGHGEAGCAEGVRPDGVQVMRCCPLWTAR